MIERWFPCREVSEQSPRGWGRGLPEKSLFTWFASRPLAQAKAVVICSLLPWPDTVDEQERLKSLVRQAMLNYDSANRELRDELSLHYPEGATLCDPFSGRATIPSEAGRLGVRAWGIDYSPVATLAGRLLADWPMRDWDGEPDLPHRGYREYSLTHWADPRLMRDVGFILNLAGRRYEQSMREFYPEVEGSRPWGYLWAVTVPCTGCGNRFPLTGNLSLRNSETRGGELRPGQSYRIAADARSGTFKAEVHEGPPDGLPTLVKVAGRHGKTGVCCFCRQAHPLETLKRLMRDGLHGDTLLVVADHDPVTLRRYRAPTEADLEVMGGVRGALDSEAPFAPGLPAVPSEPLSRSLAGLIGPAGYGYSTWGEICNDRQTLGLVRMARIIGEVSSQLTAAGLSADYVEALSGYLASVFVRRLKRSTRGTTLGVPRQDAGHVYTYESSIAHSFDYFETSCYEGPATWGSLARHSLHILKKQVYRIPGLPATIQRGSATELPLPDGFLDAVVTDPPYDKMLNYCDSSDLMYVWLKRALLTAAPWFGITSDPDGLQEKDKEAVITRGAGSGDHRTAAHYRKQITRSFEMARGKSAPGGVVCVVFGHGDPDAWVRVLSSLADAGLVLTGSWPCSTEKGGNNTGEHIDNTIVMAARPAPSGRPVGNLRIVSQQIEAEVAERIPQWVSEGMTASDQRMAAIAPAMEIVGMYREVLDIAGKPVPMEHFLGAAHRAVEEASDERVGNFRIAEFDRRTRFALSWARRYGRGAGPGSAARWLRLSYGLADRSVGGILVRTKGGQRMAYSTDIAVGGDLSSDSSLVDLALAAAGAGRSVTETAALVGLPEGERRERLWATLEELSRLVGETDEDGQIWAWAVRNRPSIEACAEQARHGQQRTSALISS